MDVGEKMKKMLRRTLNEARYIYHVLAGKDVPAIIKWYHDKGDDRLRIDYELNENSVVFDVGGFKGEWSELISRRYDPYIYVFEPVAKFYEKLVAKFKGNKKIKVYNVALSDQNVKKDICVVGEGSSIYRTEGSKTQTQLQDIYSFITQNKIKKIDLIKINIEGGEFVLLERMIKKGIVEMCSDIQVQFHEFYPNSKSLYSHLHDQLTKTHHLTYLYPFIWENWKRN